MGVCTIAYISLLFYYNMFLNKHRTKEVQNKVVKFCILQKKASGALSRQLIQQGRKVICFMHLRLSFTQSYPPANIQTAKLAAC